MEWNVNSLEIFFFSESKTAGKVFSTYRPIQMHYEEILHAEVSGAQGLMAFKGYCHFFSLKVFFLFSWIANIALLVWFVVVIVVFVEKRFENFSMFFNLCIENCLPFEELVLWIALQLN